MFPWFLLRGLMIAVGLSLWWTGFVGAEIGPVVVVGVPPLSPEVEAMNHKLETLVIPRVDFRNKPFGEAVEFLRAEAQRLDTDAPEQRGVNIFVKLPKAKPDEAALVPGPIDLTMERVTLISALRAVAAKEGMKVKVEPFAVSLVPLGEQTEPMVTASVRMSPEDLNRTLRPAEAQEVDVRGWLMKKGMTFPPGSSATYVSNSGKLVVRNTEANVEVLKKVFEQPAVGQE